MVRTKYFFGLPGLTFVQDFEIVNTIIQCVTRSGMTYKDGLTDLFSNAGEMNFTYEASSGTITFLQAFNGPLGTGRLDRTALEKVSIKFKIP